MDKEVKYVIGYKNRYLLKAKNGNYNYTSLDNATIFTNDEQVEKVFFEQVRKYPLIKIKKL